MQGHFQKNLRRTVMRYVNLSTILVYRLVSKKVISIYLGRDTELNENEFLPVSNLTLCLLSASPDTFVRQGMRWNFNDQLPRNLFISPIAHITTRSAPGLRQVPRPGLTGGGQAAAPARGGEAPEGGLQVLLLR